MPRIKIGDVLLENKLVTEKQLEEALELQKVYPSHTVGQLLCKLGFLQEDDLVYVLEQSGKRQQLSEMLIQQKLISASQVTKALTFAKEQSIPLHQALLKLNMLDEADLARLIAVQHDLSFVHIDDMVIEQDLARYINASYSHKQKIVPIAIIGNNLTLAMFYPLKLNELKDLESAIRLKIIPVIAAESEILLAQKRLYKTVSLTADPVQIEKPELEISPDSIVDILSITESDEPDIDDEVLKVTDRDSVVVKLVNKIIYDAYKCKASDIHVEPSPGKGDVIVRMRIDGKCKIYQRIPYRYKYAIPARVKIMAQLDIADKRRPQDGKINFKKYGPLELELRVATMPTAGQLEDVVIRLLNTDQAVSITSLGLSERNLEIFNQNIKKPYGLILVVGPTGSGKTTTLHSALASINTSEVKIWTAEDPVEITQKGLRQVQVHSKIGLTFPAVLRSFLRLDPDVILIGEMRDEETVTIAIESSLTGHLVFSSLHTNSAPETATRLLEMGMDPFSFSDSLNCVLAQRLVRTLCKNCKESYTPSPAEKAELVEEYGVDAFAASGLDLDKATMARAEGCNKCSNGYLGRIGIHELMEATDSLKNLLRKRKETDVIRAQAIADGMTTLKQDGIIKVMLGLTDLNEIHRVCIK